MTGVTRRRPAAVQAEVAVAAAAYLAGLPFEVARRLADRDLVRPADGGSQLRDADGLQQRDALRGGEAQVVGRHPVRPGNREQLLVLDGILSASTAVNGSSTTWPCRSSRSAPSPNHSPGASLEPR